MNAILERWYWTASILPLAAALSFTVFLAVSFARLPSAVPVHFGLDGSPNGYMPKGLFLVLTPLLLAGLAAIVFTTKPGSGALPFHRNSPYLLDRCRHINCRPL